MPQTQRYHGHLHKMHTQLNDRACYELRLGEDIVDMNALIDQVVTISFDGIIHCVHCGRQTKKSFNQGYCYPCFSRLAQCDLCIVKPERCHFHLGTCREPEWGEAHCMIPHVIYLANSTGVKVGITRKTQIPTRWIDQGAIQALAILEVNSRYQSGVIETLIAEVVNDKTHWRRLVKEDAAVVDLPRMYESIKMQFYDAIQATEQQFGTDSVIWLEEEVVNINYPIQAYPQTIKSVDLMKMPEITDRLMGIKGQYLLMEHHVINMRKHAGFEVTLLTGNS